MTIIDPMPSMTAILGAAQMDLDPADEIALINGDERLVIVDSATGDIQFDSDGYGWNAIFAPAFNWHNTIDNYAGFNYGFDVFCDEDGDGIRCLMVLISEGSLYYRQLAVICLQGGGLAEIGSTDTPAGPRLARNTPNPFNPSTEIAFDLSRAGQASLRIFDLQGRQVRVLFEGELPAGAHSLSWDGTDDAGRALASGTYVYRLEAEGTRSARKSLLLK